MTDNSNNQMSNSELFIKKGAETSWEEKIYHNKFTVYFFLILYSASMILLCFKKPNFVFLLLGILLLLILLRYWIATYSIEISANRIAIKKYFLGFPYLKEELEREEIEEYEENKTIYEFRIKSNGSEIKVFRHVPSFDSEDEPWISIEKKSKTLSIRTISEEKSIACLNWIKDTVIKTKKITTPNTRL